MPVSRHIKRLSLLAACACTVGAATQAPASSADISSQINANKSFAQTLQSQINAETAQIAKTQNGVAAATAQLNQINYRLDTSVANLKNVQVQLMEARDQVLALEHRLKVASEALAANLRAQYENGSPNLVDVILSSNGFTSLLDQVNYLKDAQSQDRQIVAFTKTQRAQVMAETVKLGNLEQQDQTLTNNIVSQRNQQAAIEGALLQQQINEQQARNGKRSRLAQVQSQTQALQHRLNQLEAAAAAKAAQTATQVNQQVGGIAINTGAQVTPPANAPLAVKEMIAAGNAIATLPYIWGGGHASFHALGYDCSGSVSFVLAAAGLLSSPEVSGQFESYGAPGPGQWVTIYANSTHVWMQIAGWRFDTVALAEIGTRWSQGGGEFSGFVVRHPVGM